MAVDDAEPSAVSFIEEHGGAVRVGVDAAGLKHVALAAPTESIEWVSHRGQGFTLFTDASIAPADAWVIALRHVPRRHIEAFWNGTELQMPGGGAASSW